MNGVIDFIEADTARAAPVRRAGAALLPLALVALSSTAAMVLRADFVDFYAATYLTPAALMLALLAAAAWVALAPASRARWRLLWGCVTAALILSLAREGMPLGVRYADAATFWREAGSCFVKGLGTSLIASLLLTFAVFRWRPLPNGRWQLALGALAGLAGVVMLNLHCASAHWGHIVLGHWGQGLPLVLWTVCLQRWLLTRRLGAVLGDHATRLAHTSRLADG